MLRYIITDGYAFFRVEDVETVLRALAAPPSPPSPCRTMRRCGRRRRVFARRSRDHTAGGVHAIYVSATRLVAALDAQGRACRQRLPLPTEDGDTDVCGEPAVTVDENDTPLCREHGGTKR